jgi:hypothetical protein
MWFLDGEYDFDTYESDYDTHECYYDTHKLNFNMMRVISARTN